MHAGAAGAHKARTGSARLRRAHCRTARCRTPGGGCHLHDPRSSTQASGVRGDRRSHSGRLWIDAGPWRRSARVRRATLRPTDGASSPAVRSGARSAACGGAGSGSTSEGRNRAGGRCPVPVVAVLVRCPRPCRSRGAAGSGTHRPFPTGMRSADASGRRRACKSRSAARAGPGPADAAPEGGVFARHERRSARRCRQKLDMRLLTSRLPSAVASGTRGARCPAFPREACTRVVQAGSNRRHPVTKPGAVRGAYAAPSTERPTLDRRVRRSSPAGLPLTMTHRGIPRRTSGTWLDARVTGSSEPSCGGCRRRVRDGAGTAATVGCGRAAPAPTADRRGRVPCDDGERRRPQLAGSRRAGMPSGASREGASRSWPRGRDGRDSASEPSAGRGGDRRRQLSRRHERRQQSSGRHGVVVGQVLT